jgi:hypothetical protein
LATLFFFLYFVPSIIALARSKASTLSHLSLGCFLGWMLDGSWL